MKYASLAAALAALLLLHPPTLSAAGPADALAREILQGTRTSRERAERLMKAARTAEDGTAIQLALLEKAYEQGKLCYLGAGFEIGEQALDLLAKAQGDQAARWRLLRMDLYRQGFKRTTAKSYAKRQLAIKLAHAAMALGDQMESAGDWRQAMLLYKEAKFPAHTMNVFEKDLLSQRYDRANHFFRLQARTESLQRSLASNPDSAATRTKLIHTLLVDLDRPADAAKLLTPAVDEMYRTYVPLAAKDAAELELSAAKELATWYHQVLLPKARDFSKDLLLTRTLALYDRCLALTPEAGASRTKLKLLRSRVAEEIAQRTPPHWVNLLKHLDVDRRVVRGQWKQTANGPRGYAPAQQSALIGFGVEPTGDYELEVEFIRHSWGKPDSVHVTCPVGSRGAVNVILSGYGKDIAGFENIRGSGGSTIRENGTAVPCRVSNERVLQLNIEVHVAKGQAHIQVRYRKGNLMEWRGSVSDILPGNGGVRLGLGAGWRTSISYPIVKIRTITGKLASAEETSP